MSSNFFYGNILKYLREKYRGFIGKIITYCKKKYIYIAKSLKI